MEKLYGTLRGEGTLTGELTMARASVSISVDSDVTTGAPGTPARVDNLGTNRDAVLKFTIPQGPRGEKGETGNPGQDGKDGNDGPMGPQGNPGSDGTTFTPQVSSEGVISWSNDGGKQNPTSRNIKGPAGQDGSDGQDGTTFTPQVSSEGVISWSNDGGKQNPESRNIKGPAGQNGQDGERGFSILSVVTPPTDASVKSTINPQDEDVPVSINDTIQYQNDYVYLVTDDYTASLKTAYELHNAVPYPDWQQVSGPEGQVFGWAANRSMGYSLDYTAISPDTHGTPQEGDVIIVNDSNPPVACVVVDYGEILQDGDTWEYLHVEEKYGTNNYLTKNAPIDCYIPVATVEIQAGVDEVLVGDIVKYDDFLLKVNSISEGNAYLDEPQNIKGEDGTDGMNGERGFSILSVTTAPTAYSGTIFGKNYTYRISTSIVKTQAGVTKGLAGDILKYNTNLYPVVYANNSYLYMTDPTDIKGAQGPAGDDGTTFTPSVSQAGVLSWTNDGGKQNPQSVDITAAVLAALPTWQGGTY